MVLKNEYIVAGIIIALLIGSGAGYIYGQSPIAGYKEEVDRLKTENLGIREKKAQLLEENTALQYQLEVVTTNLSSTRSSLDLALGKLSKSEEDYEELEKEKEEEIENLIMQLETLNETYQNLILTYSSKFVISDLVINIDEVEINQPVKISVTVKNIGGLEGSYNLQLKIGDVIEASKELTLMGGESITTSFDLTKDEVGIYNFTLNGLSGTFNVIRPLWCEIGVPYVAADGLTVTLTSLEIKEKTGSYQYTIWYTLKNEQPNEVIDEGSFKMYYANESGGLPQYGFFGQLFPGDALARTYTFEELKSKPFGVLEYHHENFFSSEPLEDSLKWKVEIP